MKNQIVFKSEHLKIAEMILFTFVQTIIISPMFILLYYIFTEQYWFSNSSFITVIIISSLCFFVLSLTNLMKFLKFQNLSCYIEDGKLIFLKKDRIDKQYRLIVIDSIKQNKILFLKNYVEVYVYRGVKYPIRSRSILLAADDVDVFASWLWNGMTGYRNIEQEKWLLNKPNKISSNKIMQFYFILFVLFSGSCSLMIDGNTNILKVILFIIVFITLIIYTLFILYQLILKKT